MFGNGRGVGPQREETEAPAHGNIDDSDAAVRAVHSAEDVQVVGQAKATMKGRSEVIRQIDGSRRLWIRFEQIYRFPQDFAQIGAIDLVDVQKVVVLRSEERREGGRASCR